MWGLSISAAILNFSDISFWLQDIAFYSFLWSSSSSQKFLTKYEQNPTEHLLFIADNIFKVKLDILEFLQGITKFKEK